MMLLLTNTEVKNFGLNNLGSFLSSAIDGGFGYNLPRRFAKYYGPQEGEGGNINIKYAQGGQNEYK